MSTTDRPACERVRFALDAVLTSETFARSERLRSFLAYIVQNELSGKAAQLKGYSIGIDVFGRTSGFDAGNDPLVRVQAGKLRKLLDQYYETEGASDSLRIRVPLGSYVPEYTLRETGEVSVPPTPATARAVSQPPKPRRPWIPAPVSSPLALLSLLPLVFLAPFAYPDQTDAAIAKAQFALVMQSKLADKTQDLPHLHILQCWPAGGDCNALARAMAGAASYHKTVRLIETHAHDASHVLSYAIRIENGPNGGVYARLIHEQSGATVFARHFSSEQLRSEAGLSFEAVAFVARALSANGPLYRHALRGGTASGFMECLTREAKTQPHGVPYPGGTHACPLEATEALADAAETANPGTALTR